MKMNILRWLGMAWMAIVVVGCLPEPLPVEDIPKLESKLVISSQMLPRQGLTIVVTKSLGALDAGSDSDPQAVLEQIVVDDAVVTLHYSDRVDTLINVGSGVYEDLTVAWHQDISYTLNVKTESLGEVSSATELVTPVPFDSVHVRLVYSSLDSLLQVNYTLTDPPGKNYYVVSVQGFSNLQDLSSLLNPTIFNHLIEDTEFDGREMHGEFTTFFPRFSRGDSIAVFLSTVSPEYFTFLQLRNDDEYNLATFASEPLRYPTNVQGGYGFFNLHVPNVRLFRLP